MADEIDDGNQRAEAFTQTAIRLVTERPRTVSTGVCRSCGGVIESDRLRAQPHAADCHECAEAAEEDRARVAKVGRG